MNATELDSFTLAYVVAALWASTVDNGEPMDQDHDRDDIAPETLAKMVEDCRDFQTANGDTYRAAGWSDEQAGHDFWLTRNGHGAGFWDRGWDKNGEGRALTDAAHAYGSVYLYVGDDGKIYA